MHDFETSLTREKFDIINKDSDDKTPVVALSNRIACTLHDDSGNFIEEIIVRGHTMHSCIRAVAGLLRTFRVGGSIMGRLDKIHWDSVMAAASNDYEKQYNPKHWIALYNDGRVIYNSGTPHHPFFDLIEKIAATQKVPYDRCIPLAEEAFRKTGQNVKISYDGNVAFTNFCSKDVIRCGLILRDAVRTTTLNFSVKKEKGGEELNIQTCLFAAAAYLEAIQLCFTIGMSLEKMNRGWIKRFSDEEKQMKQARIRLNVLSSEVLRLNSRYNVHYRPEEPVFEHMIVNAENLAKTVLD